MIQVSPCVPIKRAMECCGPVVDEATLSCCCVAVELGVGQPIQLFWQHFSQISNDSALPFAKVQYFFLLSFVGQLAPFHMLFFGIYINV